MNDHRFRKWEPTAGELLLNFATSLAALAPIAERSWIPWRDEEAYDDWDMVEEVNFDVFVRRIFESSFAPAYDTHPLPKYLFEVQNELEVSRIVSVSHEEIDGYFSCLQSGDGSFRTAAIDPVSPTDSEVRLVNVDDCDWRFLCRFETGQQTLASRIRIDASSEPKAK